MLAAPPGEHLVITRVALRGV